MPGNVLALFFCAVFCKHSAVLIPVLCRIRSRRAPCGHRFDNLCWFQRVKPFQPQTGFLCVRMPVLIRLHGLGIWRQAKHFAWHRILYADLWDICPPEPHKQIAALDAFYHALFLELMIFPEMPCSRIAEIGARRVRNEQVPLANVMRYAVHRHDLPPLRAIRASPKMCHSGCPPDGS